MRHRPKGKERPERKKRKRKSKMGKCKGEAGKWGGGGGETSGPEASGPEKHESKAERHGDVAISADIWQHHPALQLTKYNPTITGPTTLPSPKPSSDPATPATCPAGDPATLLQHSPDRRLQAGGAEDDTATPRHRGTPQGGPVGQNASALGPQSSLDPSIVIWQP